MARNKHTKTRPMPQGYRISRADAALMGIDERKDLQVNAMDIQLGGNVARPPATLTSAEVPKDIQRAQKVAYNHFCNNFIVRAIVLGKIQFFNYGLRLLVKNKPPTEKILKDWQQKWAEYEDKCNGAMMGSVMAGIRRYVNMVWEDSVVYDSVVSFYRQGAFFPLPFTIQPFRCTYTDAGGFPKLKVELDWDRRDLPQEGGNYVMGQRSMTVGKRTVDGKTEGENERWKVLTRGPFGYGFGRPGMASIFRPLGQCTSMEAGESLVGYLARSPIREHTIGHETRYGPYSGGATNFLNGKRAEATIKFWKSITGFAEVVKNFDQKTSYLWIGSDPKWFNAEKWQTIIQRVAWWGQSFGFMYITRSINPYLFPIFQQEAEAQRADVKEHIEAMLSEALDTDDLTLAWSNECFTDQRLAFEMMKFLTTQGPLSLQTGLRKAGYDPENEYEQKLAEFDKDAEGLLPLYDAAHGDTSPTKRGGVGEPGDVRPPKPGKPSGRPQGTRIRVRPE